MHEDSKASSGFSAADVPRALNVSEEMDGGRLS